MRLTHLQLLHDVGDTIKSIYFCNSGLISTLSVFPDGKSVEVGLIGREGFLGLPLIAGFRRSPVRANVQIGGSAFRLSADALAKSLVSCAELALRLHQFSQVLAMQARGAAAEKRKECQWMVRQKLGETVHFVGLLELTAKQSEMFSACFSRVDRLPPDSGSK